MTAVARKNARTAGIMALMVAGMLALAFASVPLYRMFCELTGFDGTPLRAEKAPGAVAGQIGVHDPPRENPCRHERRGPREQAETGQRTHQWNLTRSIPA